MNRQTKRLVVLADLHCSHLSGLTPPRWQLGTQHAAHPKHQKWRAIERECWKFYAKTLRQLQPIDVLVVNGDLIDGRGERSGGTELITLDRSLQCEMAVECIEQAKADFVIITYGTSYHSGQLEDWEDSIAKHFEPHSKIGAHEWLDLNGVVFDFKHKVGTSSVPHGRKTPVEREKLWNALWADAGLQPRADYVIRSHVHYCEGGFSYRGGRQVWAMTTPALQAMGTKYGARQCSGLVDFGLVHFDITPKGGVTWHPHVVKIVSQQARSLKL